MPRRFALLIAALFCISWMALSFPSVSKADSFRAPHDADTAYDLINGVNALRAAYGLPPYSINSILMYTAQAQAEFMAANGTVTHSGPGGIGVTDRLLAAGYPLAGDLSLGGFRSENITGGGENMSAPSAVKQWSGDTLHLTTMISPDLTEIGAGVAVVNGRVYYVIDCARSTGAGVLPTQALTTPIAGGSAVPVVEAPLQAVMVSTPNLEGNVIHEVKYGQSLWQIAITYETRIDEIKRLNNLSGNDIYPGEKLLIKMGIIVPTSTPMETSTPEPQPTGTSTSALASSSSMTHLPLGSTATLTPVLTDPSSRSTSSIMGVAIGIIALALLGGGLITWMGGTKKDDG